MDSYPGYAARSRKADALLQAGAVHVIATEEKSVEEEIKRLTEGKEARVVFDAVGGPSFAKLVSLTSTGRSSPDVRGCKQRNELVPGDTLLERPLGEILWLFHFDLIHHRGQLSTYLRPMGLKVPSILRQVRRRRCRIGNVGQRTAEPCNGFLGWESVLCSN
jgi:Zinc-binding dehydrogenase/DinB family